MPGCQQQGTLKGGLISGVTWQSYAPGEIVFEKNAVADHMVLVTDGHLRVLNACLVRNKHPDVRMRLVGRHDESDSSDRKCDCCLDLLFGNHPPLNVLVGILQARDSGGQRWAFTAQETAVGHPCLIRWRYD